MPFVVDVDVVVFSESIESSVLLSYVTHKFGAGLDKLTQSKRTIDKKNNLSCLMP